MFKQIAAIFLMLSLASVALGQNPFRESYGLGLNGSPIAEIPNEERIPEINLVEAPLPEALDFLRKTTGRNIVLQSSPGFDPHRILLTYELTQVTLTQVMNLLMMRPDASIYVDLTGENEPIYLVTVVDEAGHGGSVGVSSLDSVYAGRGESDNAKIEAEVSALIDAAIQTAGEGGPLPKVMFHPQTRLVVYRGTEQQVDLLTLIFTRLQEAAAQRNEAARPRERMELERQVEQGRRQLEDMKEKLAEAEARLLAEQQRHAGN